MLEFRPLCGSFSPPGTVVAGIPKNCIFKINSITSRPSTRYGTTEETPYQYFAHPKRFGPRIARQGC